MKKLIKWVFLFLLGVGIVGIVGCKPAPKPEEPEAPVEEEAPTEEEAPVEEEVIEEPATPTPTPEATPTPTPTPEAE